MKGYTAVIFDLDGTLLDTSQGILAATRQTLEEYGCTVPPEDVLRGFIGPPVQMGFGAHLGLTGEESAAYADTYRSHYEKGALFLATPYTGLEKVLCELKREGVRLAVATYKREDLAKRLLAHFSLDGYFDVIHGADAAGRRTKTDIIRLCLDELDVAPANRALMVGDSRHDAHAAAEAGVDFLGVTYGFGFSTPRDAFAAGALSVAEHPSEITGAVWTRMG